MAIPLNENKFLNEIEISKFKFESDNAPDINYRGYFNEIPTIIQLVVLKYIDKNYNIGSGSGELIIGISETIDYILWEKDEYIFIKHLEFTNEFIYE